MDARCKERNEWAALRTDYYIAGRILHLSGIYSMSGIMFGYAIETSMKHALCEVTFSNKKILMSHDFALLWKTCLDNGILTDVQVSQDFVTYVGDFFMPRYPSLGEDLAKYAEQHDRFLLKSIDFLRYYDDLMMQIDQSLLDKTQDPKCSVGIRAALQVQSYSGRALFHCNYPACLRSDSYLQVIRSMQPQIDTEVLAELKKGIDHLWDLKFMYQHVERDKSIGLDWHPSATFEYPRWETGADGKKFVQF